MGPVGGLLLVTLCLALVPDTQASLCGSYQRGFCLRKLRIFIGRGGGTYSGIAKLGEQMVLGMCGRFYNTTSPCLSDMRPYCDPVEEAELQGEVDLQVYLCHEEGRKELQATAECLSLVEENTHECESIFNTAREGIASLVQQLKMDQEGARQETCNEIQTLSTCAYGKVSGCGRRHAEWMRSIYDKKTEALRRHLDCGRASGMASIPLACLALFSLFVTFSGF